jgi:hypothetical protein
MLENSNFTQNMQSIVLHRTFSVPKSNKTKFINPRCFTIRSHISNTGDIITEFSNFRKEFLLKRLKQPETIKEYEIALEFEKLKDVQLIKTLTASLYTQPQDNDKLRRIELMFREYITRGFDPEYFTSGIGSPW